MWGPDILPENIEAMRPHFAERAAEMAEKAQNQVIKGPGRRGDPGQGSSHRLWHRHGQAREAGWLGPVGEQGRELPEQSHEDPAWGRQADGGGRASPDHRRDAAVRRWGGEGYWNLTHPLTLQFCREGALTGPWLALRVKYRVTKPDARHAGLSHPCDRVLVVDEIGRLRDAEILEGLLKNS